MNNIKALFVLKRKEYEFLPSVLSVQEKPPSPIGRMILWVLAGFLSFMLVWSFIGKVDIVATAQGKIIPDGKVKTVQPAIAGVVEEILVKDGDFVKENQLLMKLDQTISRAKLNQLNLQIHENTAILVSLAHFLKGINSLDNLQDPENSELLPERIWIRHLSLYKREVDDFRTKVSVQNHKLAKLKNQKNESEILVEKLKATLPIIRKREIAFRKLLQNGMASETEYLDLKQALIEAEFDVKRQIHSIYSLSSEIEVEKSVLAEMYSNKKLDLQNRITETIASIETAKQEQIQQEKSLSMHEIRSPISGNIQDLIVFHKGQSLNANEDVLRVVPNKDELIVEAMVLNKDIGFLSVDQKAIVKVDAFNFVKYGSLDGEIIDISSDAIQDEQLGLVFKVKVKLMDNKLYIEDKYVNINSGMSVIVEAKTGNRRIIDFFIRPAKRTMNESIKER